MLLKKSMLRERLQKRCLAGILSFYIMALTFALDGISTYF